jgi:hypothetical protein
MPEELNVPPFPDILAGVWSKFLSLHRGRTYGINGANPLSYVDIASWTGVTGISVSVWELNVVMELDSAFFRARSD